MDQDTQPLPSEPVYPLDLDLTNAQAFADKCGLIAVSNPSLTQVAEASKHLHALIAEVQTTRRDRDSARNTVLTVAKLIPRWRARYIVEGPEKPSEFARGLAAASETLSEVLARQMMRD